jgi:hypothetical protein
MAVLKFYCQRTQQRNNRQGAFVEAETKGCGVALAVGSRNVFSGFSVFLEWIYVHME